MHVLHALSAPMFRVALLCLVVEVALNDKVLSHQAVLQYNC
jgi:hypothetical protein